MNRALTEFRVKILRIIKEAMLLHRRKGHKQQMLLLLRRNGGTKRCRDNVGEPLGNLLNERMARRAIIDKENVTQWYALFRFQSLLKEELKGLNAFVRNDFPLDDYLVRATKRTR